MRMPNCFFSLFCRLLRRGHRLYRKDLKELAAYLAPFCRLVRDDVIDALKDETSPMQSLKTEIRNLLFPDADDLRFADAYAQTVIFALLLAHLEKANVLDLRNAYDALEEHHSLLSRSLEFLTDKEARKEIVRLFLLFKGSLMKCGARPWSLQHVKPLIHGFFSMRTFLLHTGLSCGKRPVFTIHRLKWFNVRSV